MNLKKGLNLIMVSLAILLIAILFGQLLGGYYIYNLLVGDNLPKQTQQVQAPPVVKKKVLRLDPVRFYTLQLGIFSEAKAAQVTVDKLVKLGLRPFVTAKAPYKIWLACFNDMNSGKGLEKVLQDYGFEAFVGEGIINDRALKFPSNNLYMKEKFAPLLGKYDLVLNHSLKMFKSPQISEYKLEIWENMIQKIQTEINDAVFATEKILDLDESLSYRKELKNIKEKAIIYGNGLNKIKDTKRDEGVLFSQSHLLELIAAYHQLISNVNNILDKR